MRVITVAAIAALVSSFGLSAAAQISDPSRTASSETNPAAQAGSPAAQKAQASERKICKATGTTGTRLSKQKTCMTAKEWAERSFYEKQQLDRSTRMPLKSS